MENVFVEENGVYCIDCSAAVWATDRIHETYKEAGIRINDVDFVIEDDDRLLLVEYKNACIAKAVNPGAFNPEEENKIFITARKYWDSLHYLRLLGKDKPVYYVYIIEYPNGDVTARKRLRNKLKLELPFALQENVGNGRKIIDGLDVVSIEEWNNQYRMYPIKLVEEDEGEKHEPGI